jgi:hypothetical protein
LEDVAALAAEEGAKLVVMAMAIATVLKFVIQY